MVDAPFRGARRGSHPRGARDRHVDDASASGRRAIHVGRRTEELNLKAAIGTAGGNEPQGGQWDRKP